MILVVFAIALLLIGAIGSAALSPWPKQALRVGTAALVAAGLLSIVGAFVSLAGGLHAPTDIVNWQLPLGSTRLAMDALSAWFVLAVGVLSTAAALYSLGYMQDEIGHHPVGVYSAAMCVLVASILIVFSAADVVPFLVGWELMSLSAYFLVSFHDRQSEARRAAWTYLIATHIGTAVGVFPLFAILVARSGGSTEFAAFGNAAASAGTGLCVVLFVLGLVGFGTKAGFMPMHVWLPVAHPVAPSPVSALMSGIVIKCGIYGLLRLLSWLPALPAACGAALVGVGAVSGIMGILYALSQRQIKRMLAYSSVENIGIIGIGIGVGMLGRTLCHPEIAAMGFAGAILHVLNHSLFKGLLFMSAGTVLHGTGTGDMERLGGLGRKTPVNALVFLIAAAAICALPPLNGFVSEWLIYNALFRQAGIGAAYTSVAAVGGLTALALIGGLALAAFAKVFAVVFLGEARDSTVRSHRTAPAMVGGMALLAGACVLIGLMAWLTPSIFGVLRQPAAVVAQPPETVSMNVSLPFTWRPAIAFVSLLSAIIGLTALRRQRSAAAGAEATEYFKPTWGCGFPYPAARVQYTGSSFGWSLMGSFGPVLRSRREVKAPAGYFPGAAELQTHTPDLTMDRAYEPLFGWIARSLQRLWPLQHGRIQLYLIYIVVTLLIVFAVEAFRSPSGTAKRIDPRQGQTAVHDANGGPSKLRASLHGDQP